MLDFSKTYCDLHPSEIVTNFCIKEECLIGLCASCICSHTESHIQKKTNPEYENIRTTFTKMHNDIRTRVEEFEDEKHRIEALLKLVTLKRTAIRETVENARNVCIETVNSFFMNKEKELIRKVEAEEKKQGLHCENRLNNLSTALSREVSSLLSATQELNSSNFLESFQRIKTHLLEGTQIAKKDIAEEIEKNEDYETFINFNAEHVQDVKKGLEKCISIEFNQSVSLANQQTSTKTIQNSIRQGSQPTLQQSLSKPEHTAPFSHSSRPSQLQQTMYRPSQAQQPIQRISQLQHPTHQQIHRSPNVQRADFQRPSSPVEIVYHSPVNAIQEPVRMQRHNPMRSSDILRTKDNNAQSSIMMMKRTSDFPMKQSMNSYLSPTPSRGYNATPANFRSIEKIPIQNSPTHGFYAPSVRRENTEINYQNQNPNERSRHEGMRNNSVDRQGPSHKQNQNHNQNQNQNRLHFIPSYIDANMVQNSNQTLAKKSRKPGLSMLRDNESVRNGGGHF